MLSFVNLFLIFIFLNTLFLERWGGEGEKRKRNIDVRENIDPLSLAHAPTGDRTCNPGMCPDGESTRDLPHCGMTPSQLSYTGLAIFFIFKVMLGPGRRPLSGKDSEVKRACYVSVSVGYEW